MSEITGDARLAGLEFANRKMQGNLFSKKFLTLLAVAL
ncbi:hypothetical protein LRU_02108 [Ligilactobacillus ruminis SPM0211]|uniref:Uncharacterized protein n=1 Tax=Ligilactobacillus ruminis SPM0211 TaxID=1040964 RepID=F7R302_9LACO|nr:hypothetical protein LRU_02108 [Ligilactobacillus ruminis SPM0211]